jgi:transcription antitermination factor NusG
MIKTATSHTRLSANHCHLHESEARWFAVFTPYKREKTAVTALRRKGIECYVPLIEKKRRYTRKIVTFNVPLINNYIFVRICQNEYVSVLQARDVSHFLKFDGQLIAVPDDEINLLKRIVGETTQVFGREHRPLVGQEVEILNGKLTGIRGVIVKQKGKNQVLVDLDTLGWSLQLEVDPKYLRPIV